MGGRLESDVSMEEGGAGAEPDAPASGAERSARGPDGPELFSLRRQGFRLLYTPAAGFRHELTQGQQEDPGAGQAAQAQEEAGDV